MERSIIRKDVTPEEAAAFLQHNVNNRSLRQTRVRAYAADMERGMFRGDAVHIQFDTNGRLINGQHTCSAIVMSGITLRDVIVETGCDPQVSAYLDRGLPKNATDALAERGAVSASRTASIIRASLCLRDYPNTTWSGKDVGAITQALVVSEYESRPTEYDQETAYARQIHRHTFLSETAIGTLISHGRLYDDPEFLSFSDGLISGANLREGDPRLALRSWIPRSHIGPTRGFSSTTQYRVACVIKAWNAYMRGESLKILRWDFRALPMPEIIRPSSMEYVSSWVNQP
jgi:hypothetical protein